MLLFHLGPYAQKVIKKRKERFFPSNSDAGNNGMKARDFPSFPGTLTVEAAMVLPLFLFCMIAALQYCCAMETAVKFAAALSETGKTMAAASYVTTYTGDATKGAAAVAGVFSLAYAQSSVLKQAGGSSAVKNANLALSTLLKENEMIDLVLTYQINSPFGVISLPGTFFIQRAGIRAWVGRSGSGRENTAEEEEGPHVYVTQTGSVYHTTLECTYLKLSVSSISLDQVESARNKNGAKYYSCELCGSGCGNTVYITAQGNRYHSTLSCSGLKRTVIEVPLSEVGDLPVCSRCG